MEKLVLSLFPAEKIKKIERNKLDPSDRRFHSWYRFVLSYPPHLVHRYIEEFGLSSKDLVLDPFCGTGTTLIEAKLLGVPSIGIEANPFAHFATTVKTNWKVDPIALLQIANEIKTKADGKLSEFENNNSSLNATDDNLELKELPVDHLNLLLKDSISPLPLHKCLILLDFIREYKNSEFYDYLALALANSAVFKFSNLRFGPEVGVGKIKTDAPVIQYWYDQVLEIVNDLSNQPKHAINTESHVLLSDSRNLKEILQGYKISAVITSPPYPNEKDYTRTTRLESVLLGFIDNKEDLRKFKKTLLRSNTRGVYKGDDDDDHIELFPEIKRIADEIEAKRIELGKTSGFEKLYAKVTKLYFGGMAKHLAELRPFLTPGAMLAYVVGDQASYLRVMIRTGHLLGDIAQSLGYELIRIDLFRTRFSTATKSDLNEEVVILRWPG